MIAAVSTGPFQSSACVTGRGGGLPGSLGSEVRGERELQQLGKQIFDRPELGKQQALVENPEDSADQSLLERLRQSGAPAVITQMGREAAVLIDIESFRRSEAEREILAALARGEQEIAQGMGYDLDEVLAEADHLLARPIS